MSLQLINNTSTELIPPAQVDPKPTALRGLTLAGEHLMSAIRALVDGKPDEAEQHRDWAYRTLGGIKTLKG